MYFTSKDREKLKTENATASVNNKIDSDYKAFKKKHFDSEEEANQEGSETVNPTDSYSARTVNPEYISRSSSEQASEDEQNYYVEGYTPTNTYDSYSSSNYNNYNTSNNNNWNNNNWGNNNNFGYGYSPYNSWYSPYYGYCNPSMSPYYSGGSGLTISLGYTWGNMGYNSYYNPYSYYPSYYSPYYPNYYGYPNYYSGGSESNANYGKRPSRHSAVVTPTPRSRERVSSNTNGSTNGRTRPTSDEYYVKPWRRVPTYEKTTDGYSTDRYVRPSSTDNSGTRSRDSYNSNTRESRPTYSTPSRSSSGNSSPSRSSGGSSTPKPRGRD
jgi:hypothetical protein